MVFAPLTDDSATDDGEVGVSPLKGDDLVGGGLPKEDDADSDAKSVEELRDEEIGGEEDAPDMGLSDEDFNAM